MGNSMLARGVRPMERTARATPLLGFLAGPHAGAIARVWPGPHASFFALPTARRHAAAILLLQADETWGNGDAIAMAVERARDSEVAAMIMPDGDVPGGLMKALGRMGETLWETLDYKRFLDLFADVRAVRVLRHMKAIAPDSLGLIEPLPLMLREAAIISAVPSRMAAIELANTFDLVKRMRGDVTGAGIVQRWVRAKDKAALFRMAGEDLEPMVFGGPPPVPVLPAPFEAVTTPKALGDVALGFNNCLRDFNRDLAAGRMAVYVWRGDAKHVALALRSDPVGWRLAEAKIKGNSDVADAPLKAIVAALAKVGVRTGGSMWTIKTRLHAHACDSCGPAYNTPNEGWRAQLELGELWD